MHQSLESRLAAAEELRKTAELEKLEKEKSARNALAEQEIIMEKVVQESKILQKEAEENAKVATHCPLSLVVFLGSLVKLNNNYLLLILLILIYCSCRSFLWTVVVLLIHCSKSSSDYFD